MLLAHGGVFAVIVSGGMNKLMNHERYFNDCAFLYSTLRRDCHLERDHIFVLMSDGGAPGDDMMVDDANGFCSSPDDLDGDGQRDVFLAATMDNLLDVMDRLYKRLTSDDHLFLFLIDHGGYFDLAGDSYLWLWGGDILTDHMLGLILNGFPTSSVNIVMGQCYSGGFIDNLQGDGRVIATACRSDELSWKCPDRVYDEFVYHWTCAIAGHDEEGMPIDADADGDGQVTMDEAFSYARQHDRCDETPQYSSTPADLGGRWSFPAMMGQTQGIHEVGHSWDQPTAYDLMGRRLAKPHGLYIEGGRKKIKKH